MPRRNSKSCSKSSLAKASPRVSSVSSSSSTNEAGYNSIRGTLNSTLVVGTSRIVSRPATFAPLAVASSAATDDNGSQSHETSGFDCGKTHSSETMPSDQRGSPEDSEAATNQAERPSASTDASTTAGASAAPVVRT